MSRETLLDDAILKAKEAEDWQLVEWLRMARRGESAARWFSDKLMESYRNERKLLDENAKLRELVRYMWFYDYAGFFTTLREVSDLREEVCQSMRELGIEVDG